MSSSPSAAADLSNDARKGLAILSLSKAEPIAHLADREGVSIGRRRRQWKRLMRRLTGEATSASAHSYAIRQLIGVHAARLTRESDATAIEFNAST
jgi:hypothetical protein